MAKRLPMARSIGVILPPVALVLGTFITASDVAQAGILLAFVISGGLINRWWAPAPSVAAWTALGLAEEANHWGFGPGTRFGTAIEIHSGGDFSLSFFALTTAVAIALPLIGLAGWSIAAALVRRITVRCSS